MKNYTFDTYYGANGTIPQVQHIEAVDMLFAVNKYVDRNLEGYMTIEGMTVHTHITPVNFMVLLFPHNGVDKAVRKITFRGWVSIDETNNTRKTVCVRVRLDDVQ